ncbi:DUF3455 domain-containing protein [Actinomycetes bacterium KLBMP 9797]
MVSRRKLLPAAALLAALLVGGGGSAAGHAAPPRHLPPVPAALAAPAGNALSSVYHARGVQVYQCTAGAWAFVEPAAGLTGFARGRSRAAVHFRGPSWQSTEDGSLVEARAVASSPVAGSIPELLLQATRTRGGGDFGTVTYLQRLATSGGTAPAGTCTDGATTGVPYRAVYAFYVPA